MVSAIYFNRVVDTPDASSVSVMFAYTWSRLAVHEVICRGIFRGGNDAEVDMVGV